MKNFGTDVSGTNKVIVVTGLPGTGKKPAYQVGYTPQNYQKSKKGTIVIDPQMEYSGGGNIFVYRLTSYADAEEETEGLIGFILANKGRNWNADNRRIKCCI